jgi:acyl carrier protein
MRPKPEILDTLTGYMQEIFALPAERITTGARLVEDLGLDSIDAVELMVKLQEYTGKKLSPDDFKAVRTVGDVVDKLHDQFSARS